MIARCFPVINADLRCQVSLCFRFCWAHAAQCCQEGLVPELLDLHIGSRCVVGSLHSKRRAPVKKSGAQLDEAPAHSMISSVLAMFDALGVATLR